MKVFLSIAALLFLVGCSSVPQRPRTEYSLGSVTIILTDPDEIWDRFGCEGRLELLPNGTYRIWAPMPDADGDRHAWEVLGHEISHVLERTTPTGRNPKVLSGNPSPSE